MKLQLPVGPTGAFPDWLQPPWDLSRIGAVCTSRRGGVSQGAFASMNIGDAVDDDPAAVAANRRRLLECLGGAQPVYLRQVHGTRVVELDAATPAGAVPQADASVTATPGIACVVQTADCLPVLFAAPASSGVAAAHAGWRGLAGGILESTVEALCGISGAQPGDLRAWLGPCIGPQHFEVGADVLEAFGVGSERPDSVAACFVAADPRASTHTPPHPEPKWRADLPALARLRLFAAGVRQISGGDRCTAADGSRFFSFRRDRVCGRMAAAVWLRGR